MKKITKSIAPMMSMLLIALVLVAGTGCQKEISTANRTPETLARTPEKTDQSIAGIAISNGFSELVAALSYVDDKLDAGLVNLFLNGKDQYTVFAPTNAAFQELYGILGVDNITEVAPETVLAVLQYHVTDGRRAANSVVPKNGSRTITTLLPGASFNVGSNLVITANKSTATITGYDLSASNGIVHVIDHVLLP
jgi:uncharacterized surface protein with fasciclin (FAS1) repeats